jgi:hypothetical protein
MSDPGGENAIASSSHTVQMMPGAELMGTDSPVKIKGI